MREEQLNQESRDARDRERDPAAAHQPPGNPETDRDSVEMGQEQLTTISGN
jgi:hypothetical protein